MLLLVATGGVSLDATIERSLRQPLRFRHVVCPVNAHRGRGHDEPPQIGGDRTRHCGRRRRRRRRWSWCWSGRWCWCWCGRWRGCDVENCGRRVTGFCGVLCDTCRGRCGTPPPPAWGAPLHIFDIFVLLLVLSFDIHWFLRYDAAS